MNAKKAAAASDRRSAQAVELFEKAMKALGKRDYEKAQEQLSALLQNHPDQRDIAERARLFLGLCERSLEKRPAFKPKSFEDLLSYGVLLHNRGEFTEALRLFSQAAGMHPKDEHALYCMAAAAAQTGDVAGALKSLRAAILANPASRAQARVDADFDPNAAIRTDRLRLLIANKLALQIARGAVLRNTSDNIPISRAQSCGIRTRRTMSVSRAISPARG